MSAHVCDPPTATLATVRQDEVLAQTTGHEVVVHLHVFDVHTSPAPHVSGPHLTVPPQRSEIVPQLSPVGHAVSGTHVSAPVSTPLSIDASVSGAVSTNVESIALSVVVESEASAS